MILPGKTYKINYTFQSESVQSTLVQYGNLMTRYKNYHGPSRTWHSMNMDLTNLDIPHIVRIFRSHSYD